MMHGQKNIKEEQLSRGYRYPVHNGIRVVEMGLKNIYLHI
jgi:hypothetical protein